MRYIFEILNNNLWQNLEYGQNNEDSFVALSWQDKSTLDESLDEGGIVLYRKIADLNKLKRFTPTRITIEDDNGNNTKFYRLIGDVNCQRLNNHLYKYKINTIELTKQLEREHCDTLTFTNHLGHEFNDRNIVIPIYKQGNPNHDLVYKNNYLFMSPLPYKNQNGKDTIVHIPAIKTAIVPEMGFIIGKKSISIKSPSKTINIDGESSYNLNVAEIGTYIINIYFNIWNEYGGYDENIQLRYNISSVEDIPNKSTYTITQVIDRILAVHETRRYEQQKYYLQGENARKYANIVSPEFHITKCSLFEALLEVGKFIQAIPRLVWNEDNNKADTIVFDEIGGNDVVKKINGDLIARDIKGNADEYCGEIDCYVDNLLNTRDLEQGAIIEPCNNGYKTTRCEDGQVELCNNSAIILTDFPIYRIVKLEIGYVNSSDVIGDITPYVYETAEYETLSDYHQTYPYSMGWALKYRQGDNKITQLAHKTQTGPVKDVIPVIDNILTNFGFSVSNYKNLAFRVTYIPAVSARLKQRKAYLQNQENNSLFFNQSANTVETEYLGENMKGVVARMGNIEDVRTYKFINYTDIPKVGQLYDNKYITQVICEFWPKYIKATIVLTEDYNKLNEYIGINSNYRLYEISEKQSIDRHINYSENVIIGDDIENADDNNAFSFITALGVKRFANVFNQISNDGFAKGQVSCSVIEWGDDKLLMKSCLSTAVGNSLAFNFAMKDNFSAGYKAVDDSTSSKAMQQAVPYGDNYGEIETLNFALAADVVDFDWNSQNNDGRAMTLPDIQMPLSFIGDDWITDRKDLESSKLYFRTAFPFIIRKDSRENLIFTNQLHMIANRKSIILGSALTANNPLITNTRPERQAKFYFLPKKLNKFGGIVDLTDAVEKELNLEKLIKVDVDIYNPEVIKLRSKRITIKAVCNDVKGRTFQAWALIDPSTNKLYIGENMEFKQNQYTLPIIFNFVSNNADVIPIPISINDDNRYN